MSRYRQSKVAQIVPQTYDLPYTPHEYQGMFHKDPHRFRVLSCGRRWGKSKASIAETYQCLVEAAPAIPTNKVPRAWVIAPTFALVEEDWRIALELFGPVLIDRNVAKMSMIIPINNGRAGEIEFKSAERKDEGLRGAGICFALLDEASRIPREAWELGIRPALADYRGRAVFISTPAGRNWFHDIWNEGQKPDSEWKSWKFPSNLNPYLPTEEWEAIKRSTPSLIFQQEYMAEFLEDSGMVFHGLDRCSGPGPQPAQEGSRYSIGVDLARTVDFTVITVLNEKGQVVYLNRSKELSWDHQKKLIHRIWSQYSVYSPCQVIMDSSGVGDPIEYDLRKMGVPTVGVKTQSSVLKSELIEGLMVAIEQGWIQFPSEQLYPEHRWLWEEMRSFESEVLPSGHIRYQAPPGKHDDGVMSLCLAAHGFRGVLGKNKPESHIGEQKYTTYEEYNEMSNPRKPHTTYIGKFGVRVAPMVSPR